MALQVVQVGAQGGASQCAETAQVPAAGQLVSHQGWVNGPEGRLLRLGLLLPSTGTTPNKHRNCCHSKREVVADGRNRT